MKTWDLLRIASLKCSITRLYLEELYGVCYADLLLLITASEVRLIFYTMYLIL
jgi:hypothetical protein